MAWDRAFFDQRRLTSKLKHLVLRSYFKEFAYHLGSVRSVVYYVDGFAGAGVYRRDDVSEDGSPLLIARLAEQFRTAARPFTLRCLNVESNRKRFKDLDGVTKPFRPEPIEKNYRGTFIGSLPDILVRIGDAPTFFFIDPFGAKGIAFKDLLPVFNRRDRTEVLITLQTDGFAKKAGYFAHEDSDDPKRREIARDLIGHLVAALGISHEKLKQGWLDSKTTTEFENRVLNYYLKRLTGRGTQFNYAKASRVLYYREDALKDAPVCFHLVFATQNEKGLFVMNDRMVDAVRTFYAEVYSNSFFRTSRSSTSSELVVRPYATKSCHASRHGRSRSTT